LCPQDEERKAYCEETKCTSILDKIITQGYKALQLEYFFTGGEDEAGTNWIFTF
jgi:obg-like ATPase 1